MQPNGITVQEVINTKLSILLSENIKCMGCGRTDTGVHATEFYAHFDCSNTIENRKKFVFKLNSFLPQDIAIDDLFLMKPNAHTRFDATLRGYKYIITTKKDAFRLDTALYIRSAPNVALMNKACALFKQHIDYECFTKVNTEVNNYNCEIKSAFITEENGLIIFNIIANRFLRGMIRAIMGTLLKVGNERISVADFEKIILSKDRKKAGESVAAKGLFLNKVEYPDNIFNGE